MHAARLGVEEEGFALVVEVDRAPRDLLCLARCVKGGSAISMLPLSKAHLHSCF